MDSLLRVITALLIVIGFVLAFFLLQARQQKFPGANPACTSFLPCTTYTETGTYIDSGYGPVFTPKNK